MLSCDFLDIIEIDINFINLWNMDSAFMPNNGKN